ncbi:hypothetical protein [Streptomyces rubiginosohelvolus]|uniref:hypothetical protein n=1 Tax=Streptomyces rubiginosohelvolus TaxID=67362 RepID=UPI0033B522FD
MDDVSADQPTEGSSGGDGGPGRRRWILALVLPEPETFTKGIRYGYVCPGSRGAAESPEPSGAPDMPYGYDTSDGQCVRLYAHAYTPQRTRIYLRAHFEPGISPLPSAPSSPPSVG